MNSYIWSRDGGFYKCHVVKSLLVLTGASSLLDYVFSVRNHYPTGLLSLRVWALPTPGMWLLASMILYYCRVLERREKTTKFLSKLCLSCALGVGAAGLMVLSTDFKWSQFVGSRGALVHILVGVLLVQHLTAVAPSHSSVLSGLRLSGNIPFYLLTAYFSFSSITSILLTFCGMTGGLLVHATRFPLPSLPNWVESGYALLLGRDTPSKLYSGASLQVQRQQRMDEVENMFQQLQQRQVQQMGDTVFLQIFRHVRIGDPIPAQPAAEPPAEQVEQLIGMGFSRDESLRALVHTGSNLEAAIQLLTARQH